MTTHRPTTADAVRSLLEDNAPSAGHLSTETLFAYRRNALPSAAREAAQDHLSNCPECAELLLDIAAFDSPEIPDDKELLEDDLRLVAQRLRRMREASQGAEVSRRPHATSRGWGFWAGYALAATFLITTVGLTVRLATLQQMLDTPRSFQPFDWELSRRSAEIPPILQLAADADGLALYIYLDAPPYSEYALRLEQPEGTEVWTLEGLRSGEEDSIRLFLPRRAVPRGTVVLHLFGRDGQRQEEIRTVTVEIRHQS